MPAGSGITPGCRSSAVGPERPAFIVSRMSAPVLQELNDSVYDLLDWIRKRPGLYIAEPSLNRLHAFLAGYTAGLGRAGFTLRDTVDFHRFQDWVANRLGYAESTSGWCNMIRNKSASETEAFQAFFSLLDEFRKETA